MKKIYFLTFIFAFLFSQLSKSQTVSGVDDLTLTAESYWNGSNGSGGFSSANVRYINHYNANWASWSGFSYSNITDKTTSGYVNQYSAITGKGAENTNNYIVGYGNDSIVFGTPVNLSGLYVTNSTYAYFDMLNGSSFSKKFTTNDWFKLTIKGFDKNKNQTAVADYYLADFRFTDISKNYILNEWKWIDLSSFTNVSYITFERSSSDVGSWGMNTPDYFCMDELKVQSYTGVKMIEISQFKIGLNHSGGLTIKGNASINSVDIFDLTGKSILSKAANGEKELIIGNEEYLKGAYILRINTPDNQECHKVFFK